MLTESKEWWEVHLAAVSGRATRDGKSADQIVREAITVADKTVKEVRLRADARAAESAEKSSKAAKKVRATGCYVNTCMSPPAVLDVVDIVGHVAHVRQRDAEVRQGIEVVVLADEDAGLRAAPGDALPRLLVELRLAELLDVSTAALKLVWEYKDGRDCILDVFVGPHELVLQEKTWQALIASGIPLWNHWLPKERT